MTRPAPQHQDHSPGLPAWLTADIEVGGTMDTTDPDLTWTSFRRFLALLATPAA